MNAKNIISELRVYIKNYDAFMDIANKIFSSIDIAMESGADGYTYKILNNALTAVLREAKYCLESAKLGLEVYVDKNED